MARQDQQRYGRDRQSDRERRQSNRDQYQDYNQGQQSNQDDWAQQVPWERGRGPYRDYGWEKGESALPEFRDPSTHVAPYERDRASRMHDVEWNNEYNYGMPVERGPYGRGQQIPGRPDRNQQGPYSGVGPRNYRRSDERIMDDVCEMLTRHGHIDARNINVNVKDGEVTLTGSVNDRRTKRMAEDAVERISGIKDVHNQLKVQNQQGQGNQSGMPGGGKGRVDEVGGSGVYPASGPLPPGNAPVQGEASWGQGDRGAAGYQDSGSSEISNPKPQKGQRKQS